MPHSPTAHTRRDLLRFAGLSVLGFDLAAWLRAAEALGQDDAKSYDPLNRFPRMVQEHFVDRVREADRIGRQRLAKLKTKADAESYVKACQTRIRTSFGDMPEKTPLKAKVTGVVERDAYKIEKIVFESRPGFLVTANLYVPRGRKFPLPGVVGTCGHSSNGKANRAYQSFSQGLARMGYVVLIYDPIGQGERLQYPDEMLKSTVGVGVREHLLAGNQQFLVGEFFGAWRAWDGIRALDYLLTRDEVDPNHVGVTGNSGGGTMTTWLCGVESRWTMAAPSCFVTSFRRNLENELPADTEQCPPKALALGLDHRDFLAAMAPKPVIILAKEKDYFDARGSEETYAELQQLYRLFGREEDVGLFIGPTYHGYSQENREAMYRWFNRVTGVSDAQKEPELKLEEDETLYCTPKGQVAPLGSRTVFSFTKERSQQLRKDRAPAKGKALRAKVQYALFPKQFWKDVERAAKARGAQPPVTDSVPRYRILRPRRGRGYPKPHATTYAVETEPGVHALVYRLNDERLYSRPPKGIERAVLYVSHHSADRELRNEPLIRELLKAEPQAAFYTMDVRGVGESMPNTCGEDSFLKPYGCDYFYAIHALMLNRPYVGQKTHDVLRVLAWLKAQGHERVHLAGLGWGTLPATFAAVLSELPDRVTLKHALTSYADVAETEHYDWPLSSFVPDVLAKFDLPDCYAELKRTRELRLIEPQGAAG